MPQPLSAQSVVRQLAEEQADTYQALSGSRLEESRQAETSGGALHSCMALQVFRIHHIAAQELSAIRHPVRCCSSSCCLGLYPQVYWLVCVLPWSGCKARPCNTRRESAAQMQLSALLQQSACTGATKIPAVTAAHQPFAHAQSRAGTWAELPRLMLPSSCLCSGRDQESSGNSSSSSSRQPPRFARSVAEFTVLGTGAAVPSKYRNVTGVCTRAIHSLIQVWGLLSCARGVSLGWLCVLVSALYCAATASSKRMLGGLVVVSAHLHHSGQPAMNHGQCQGTCLAQL